MHSRIKDDQEHVCYLCGGYGHEVHHIFEGSTRDASDRHGLIVHLCRICHDRVHSSKGNDQRLYLHQLAQKVYEQEIGTRQEFIKEFIKSYL